MDSIRQLQRRPKTKEELLTQGGRGDYAIDENEFRALVALFLKPKDPQTMRKLLYSLFTNRELADVVRRITVARLITQGKTFQEIRQSTNMGPSTISLVKKVLRFNPELVKMLNPEANWQASDEKVFMARLKKGK